MTVTAGSASLSQSAVTVSAATIASAATSTLTLTARDSNGNQLSSGGLTVVFSLNGGTSSGSIATVSDNNNGTYTAILTGTAAGTATNVKATIGGSSVTSTSPTLTVTSGAVSLATSLVSVSATSVASGYTVTTTVTLKDAYGNQKETGGSAIVMSRTGGTAVGTFSSVTDNSNGTYTSTFTGTTAGTATSIKATVGGSAITSTSPTITVVPGDPASIAWVTQPSTSTVAGVNFAAGQVKLLDAAGNICTNASGSVNFDIDDAFNPTNTDLLGTVDVAVVNGLASLTGAKINIASSGYKLTAGFLDLDSPSSSSITITVAAASKLTFTQNPLATAAGATFSPAVKVAVTDAFGNVVTTGGGVTTITVSIGTNPSAGVLAGTVTKAITLGVATFTDIYITTAGAGYTLNATGSTFTGSSTPFTLSSGTGQNISSAIELVDGWYGNATGSGNSDQTITRTYINGDDYDGNPQAYFEITAINTDTNIRAVTLLDGATASKAVINVPASTSAATRFISSAFTLTAGNSMYKVRNTKFTPANGLKILNARVIINQTNAYRTRLWVPLLGDLVSSTSTIIDTSAATTFTQAVPGKYAIWKKDSTKFADVSTTNGFTLEAVIATTVAGITAEVGLFNRTTGLQVAGADLVMTSKTANVYQANFENTATNFTNGDEFELRIKSSDTSASTRIYKGGMWIRLTNLSKYQTYWRTQKDVTATTTTVNPNSRVQLDTSLFSTPVVDHECTGRAPVVGNFVMNLASFGSGANADSTVVSPAAISGSGITFTSTTKSRIRATGITLSNGDRYLEQALGTSGSFDAQCWTIIRNN